jgi:hypothetical protein
MDMLSPESKCALFWLLGVIAWSFPLLIGGWGVLRDRGWARWQIWAGVPLWPVTFAILVFVTVRGQIRNSREFARMRRLRSRRTN